MARLSDLFIKSAEQGIGQAYTGGDGMATALENKQKAGLAEKAADSKQARTQKGMEWLLGKQKDLGPEQTLTMQDVGGIHKGINPAQQQLAATKQLGVEGRALNGAQKTAFGKLEDSLGAGETAKQILANPNNYSKEELKILVPQMMGWPARAMGTESKASGFDPKGWDAAVSSINKWANSPDNTPYTDASLDTLRKNFEIPYNITKKNYEAKAKEFWGNTAHNVAPTLSGNGGIDRAQAAHDENIKSRFGDLSLPWKQQQQVPNSGIAGQAAGAVRQAVGSVAGQPANPPGIGSLVKPQPAMAPAPAGGMGGASAAPPAAGGIPDFVSKALGR